MGGCGGDFARPRRDFTCLITTCCLLSLLLLIPLLLWLLSGTPTSLPYDCEAGFAQWETTWSPAPPADPYNCADVFANWQAGWSVPKKEWCCRVHGKGCPNQGGGCVTSSKPYDCNAGFANW